MDSPHKDPTITEYVSISMWVRVFILFGLFSELQHPLLLGCGALKTCVSNVISISFQFRQHYFGSI